MTRKVNASIDFFYDVASPYSYLAAARIHARNDLGDLEINWRPVLLGGIFKATNNTTPAALPARARYIAKDMVRWARRFDTPFNFSPSFPHNSLVCMRALTAAGPDQVIELSMKLFRAAWVEGKDLSLIHI